MHQQTPEALHRCACPTPRNAFGGTSWDGTMGEHHNFLTAPQVRSSSAETRTKFWKPSSKLRCGSLPLFTSGIIVSRVTVHPTLALGEGMLCAPDFCSSSAPWDSSFHQRGCQGILRMESASSHKGTHWVPADTFCGILLLDMFTDSLAIIAPFK
jgi:hypothetical protein